jgi:hypothetical protein
VVFWIYPFLSFLLAAPTPLDEVSLQVPGSSSATSPAAHRLEPFRLKSALVFHARSWPWRLSPVLSSAHRESISMHVLRRGVSMQHWPQSRFVLIWKIPASVLILLLGIRRGCIVMRVTRCDNARFLHVCSMRRIMYCT